MVEYDWNSAHIRVDAAAAAAELERIRKAKGGRLEAQDVVAEAAEPKNPLHDAFEWDDTKAAHEHRLEQARNIIRTLRVRRTGDDAPRRVYLHIRSPKESGYMTAVQVLSDEHLYKIALADAIKALRGLQSRYSEIKELAAVWAAIPTL